MKILIVEDEVRTLQHISSAITRLFPSWEIVGKSVFFGTMCINR